MIKSINNIWAVLLVMIGFYACSPEDWNKPFQNGVPAAADISANITVDQSVNQVSFSITNEECYPIWIFDGDEYSTVNGLSKIYSKYGTYEVEIKIGNSNGVSDGSITQEFTIENTLVDFNSYISRLTSDSSKEWVIAGNEEGHISNGDTGTDGTNYYSAGANEKRGMGLYDDVLTFNSDKTYNYNPGEGGTVYVNTNCSLFSEYNTGEDFAAPAASQSTGFELSVEGDDVFIKFPEKTFFPYIPFDDSYNNPKFKIVKLTNDRFELIADNGTIAWHFILASKSSVEGERLGYDPNSDCNLWKTGTFTNTYYYAPDWAQITDPEMNQEGNSYIFSFPTATMAQWQAQCFFNTDIATSVASNYDFSCKLNSTKAIGNVTVKLYANGDDETFYFVENITLNANEDTYVIYTDMPGIDIDNVNIVLDFGGNEENTEVTISDVVLKENSCDDGTVIDNTDDPGNNSDVDWNADSDCNMWNSTTFTNTYYYAPDWAQIDDPEMTQNGNAYTFSFPSATSAQWQAQCFFNSDMATTAESNYDFRCVFNSNNDIGNVTVKLYKNGDDDTFFFAENISLTAFEDFEFQMTDMEGLDIEQVNIVLDFGGNAENTEVTVSGIILKESSCVDSGGTSTGEINWDIDSNCNLWKASTFTNTYYYAPDWAQIADPEMTEEGNTYTFSFPSATSAQWQTQCFFNTDIATMAGSNFDFQCNFISTTDIDNVTVKLYKNGDDDTFYFAENISLIAYSDQVFEMTNMEGLDIENVNLVLDFGGNSENTEVTVSGIIFKESSCND